MLSILPASLLAIESSGLRPGDVVVAASDFDGCGIGTPAPTFYELELRDQRGAHLANLPITFHSSIDGLFHRAADAHRHREWLAANAPAGGTRTARH